MVSQFLLGFLFGDRSDGDTQQFPATEYYHSIIIVDQKKVYSSLIQNMIYKFIVQTYVLKTSKFVYKFQLLILKEHYVSDINVNQ